MAVNVDTEYDWQSGKSIIECNKHMWTHELLCDVTFSVGVEREEIKAHRYVLASRSCVFYAMFSNPMMHHQGDVISIPDVEPDIFKMLMKFLYFDEIKVDLNNVLALLYISKKYAVQALIDKCLKRLKSKIDPGNICTIIEAANVYDDIQLRDECLKTVMLKPLDVFTSEVFSELSSESLKLILKDDRLALDEEKIFEAVLSYAEQKCQDRGLEPNPENKRLMLGEALHEIRFPLMAEKYFSNTVEPSQILTPNECVKVMKYHVNKKGGCEIFNTKPRKQIKSVFRFYDVASSWNYQRNKQDSIVFSCSQNILVHGIVVYGSSDAQAEYEINMALKQVPFYAPVANKPGIRIKTDGGQKLYNIYFDKPAEIRKDKDYSISVVFKEGAASSFKGIDGLPETEQDGVKFTFKKCSKSTNNTSVDTGQIPAILYEVIPPE